MSSIPYRYKLTAFVQILVLMGLIVLGMVTYNRIRGLIEQEMGMRAKGVALAASYLINRRMDQYLELKTPANEQTPFYGEMKKMFQEFKASNKLRYMYTEKRVSQDKIVYILDAEPSDSEYASHIGDEDNMNALRHIAYGSKKPEYGPLTDDPVWGKFITGYAPLYNPENNEFTGLIGVDIEAAEVFKLFGEIRLVIIITIVAIFLLSMAITYKFADLMARPLFIDGLTKTYNHKYFQETLAAQVSKSEKTGNPLSVLMMDMDFFKHVNDTFGHRFGDMILMSTAKVIRDCMRKGDILARYGGEEFAAILSDTDVEQAFDLATRIRSAVEQQVVTCEDGSAVNVTISIGVAGWEPGISRNVLIDRADTAMYRSKYRNRNTVTVYDTEEDGDTCGFTA